MPAAARLRFVKFSFRVSQRGTAPLVLLTLWIQRFVLITEASKTCLLIRSHLELGLTAIVETDQSPATDPCSHQCTRLFFKPLTFSTTRTELSRTGQGGLNRLDRFSPRCGAPLSPDAKSPLIVSTVPRSGRDQPEACTPSHPSQNMVRQAECSSFLSGRKEKLLFGAFKSSPSAESLSLLLSIVYLVYSRPGCNRRSCSTYSVLGLVHTSSPLWQPFNRTPYHATLRENDLPRRPFFEGFHSRPRCHSVAVKLGLCQPGT